MITAIGSTGLRSALDALKANAATKGAPVAPAPTEEKAAAAPTPAADLAAAGAPIDLDRVASLRAAIAGGSYRIDPQAIADAMIAADLQPA